MKTKGAEEPKIVACADCETDPFKKGRTNISPFAWGIYDGCTYHEFWGDDATEQFIEFLRGYPEPLLIFAHNGGKFDWLFLFPYLTGDLMFIGSRLVKGKLFHHEVRDSYANIPVALKKFGNKIEIDYDKLERKRRGRHKKEILAYMKQDNLGLYDAIIRWREMFGTKALTMASAAMNKLKESLKENDLEVSRLSRKQDELFRPFYFGGRVECFESGVLKSATGFKVYDINSSYPAAMANEKHPIGNRYKYSKKIGLNTDFALIDATSHGALPIRDEDGSVRFPWERRVYHATGHEIRMGLKLGVLKIHKVINAIEFTQRISFAEFVHKYYGLRNAARATDQMLFEFYKLVMNSSYGKFAINPDVFKKNVLLPYDTFPDGYYIGCPEINEIEDIERRKAELNMAWSVSEDFPAHKLRLWEKPAPGKDHSFLNVACAASITGASRANLLRGLVTCSRLVYCDTDSAICEEFDGYLHDSELGAWKYEGKGNEMAIAGKKNYCLRNEDGSPLDEKGTKYKMACKGSQLTPDEMFSAASGEEIIYEALAPTFKKDGRQVPLRRTIRANAKIEDRTI